MILARILSLQRNEMHAKTEINVPSDRRDKLFTLQNLKNVNSTLLQKIFQMSVVARKRRLRA